MNLDLVIQQLRDVCPSFDQRVAGAAEFAVGVAEVSTMSVPCAWVIPLDDQADPPDDPNMPDSVQLVTERIGVVVQFSNRADRRGQVAVTDVYGMRREIFRALLNWRPGMTIDGGPDLNAEATPEEIASTGGFFYVGGQLLEFDRARLFWQYEFALYGLISEADGFIVTGHHLDVIDSLVTDPETGDETGIGAVITLP